MEWIAVRVATVHVNHLQLRKIEEAIAHQKAGREIKPDKKKPLIIPDELSAALSKSPAAQKVFEAMGLTKKREYTDYISEAKRAETKIKRLEKIMPMIVENKGLHDKYKNC